MGKHDGVFHSARTVRCVCRPDFHTLCGPAPPEVKEQKNLTLRQQNRSAYPLDSRRSRDLLFPANDSTPTEQGPSPEKADSTTEVSQHMQVMAVISPGSEDESSVSGVRAKRGNVPGNSPSASSLLFMKALWVRHALPSASAGLRVSPAHMLALWPAYSD